MSQSFAVSHIGNRIISDAGEQLESRKETAGPLEDLLQDLLDCTLSAENIDDKILC